MKKSIKNSSVVESTVVVTNKDISKYNIVNVLNIPFRKSMHSFVYFVLVILLLNPFNSIYIVNYRFYLFSTVVSFICAYSDEFHQLYVVGRTDQFIDIGIDMIGVLIGVLVFYIYGLLVKEKRLSINS